MKLKTYNQSNLQVVRSGKPTIRFSKSAGLVSISKQAAINMGLKDDSRVEFCQNEDEPKDWYIHITKSESGFSIRRKNDERNYAFNSTAVVKKVLQSLGIEGGHRSSSQEHRRLLRAKTTFILYPATRFQKNKCAVYGSFTEYFR